MSLASGTLWSAAARCIASPKPPYRSKYTRSFRFIAARMSLIFLLRRQPFMVLSLGPPPPMLQVPARCGPGRHFQRQFRAPEPACPSCGAHPKAAHVRLPMKGIRQIGAILHAKAVSATVVKPFGFGTGDGEGSRCGIRTRIALQNPVAQVVVAILWGHGPFAIPGQGGMLIGYARVSTQEDERTKPGEAPQDAPHDVLGRRDAVGGNPLTVSGAV